MSNNQSMSYNEVRQLDLKLALHTLRAQLRKARHVPSWISREEERTGSRTRTAGGGEGGRLGGGGCLIEEDCEITVICLVLSLHQSLFLDPNLCVRWQQKRYLQVHKCQSQFQAGRLPSVNPTLVPK